LSAFLSASFEAHSLDARDVGHTLLAFIFGEFRLKFNLQILRQLQQPVDQPEQLHHFFLAITALVQPPGQAPLQRLALSGALEAPLRRPLRQDHDRYRTVLLRQLSLAELAQFLVQGNVSAGPIDAGMHPGETSTGNGSGNCLLTFDQVFVSKEGKPNPFVRKRDLRSLYSPKAERMLRVLLSAPGRWWKAQPLARESGVSLGQGFNVKKLLVLRGVVPGRHREG
jgi:hypothetical protein